jgi:NADH-quinone oxidoreductase subunit C
VTGPIESFEIVSVGSALTDAPLATTPKNVPHRGGAENPSAEALRQKFGSSILKTVVGWGETTVFVEHGREGEIIRWLHDDESQQYDYLADVTAVEYRDAEVPMEVVWHLRSLPYRRFLRIKTELPKGSPLQADSVWGIYRGADWLERECYDMFGITFLGHPDMRRLLMWEQYKEGYPLRKDFPLRGRFSRSEQLRQALAANPESRYSMEELTVAEAFSEIPEDMRRRLAAGERTGE